MHDEKTKERIKLALSFLEPKASLHMSSKGRGKILLSVMADSKDGVAP